VALSEKEKQEWQERNVFAQELLSRRGILPSDERFAEAVRQYNRALAREELPADKLRQWNELGQAVRKTAAQLAAQLDQAQRMAAQEEAFLSFVGGVAAAPHMRKIEEGIMLWEHENGEATLVEADPEFWKGVELGRGFWDVLRRLGEDPPPFDRNPPFSWLVERFFNILVESGGKGQVYPDIIGLLRHWGIEHEDVYPEYKPENKQKVIDRIKKRIERLRKKLTNKGG
jgi:hypothetical protein